MKHYKVNTKATAVLTGLLAVFAFGLGPAKALAGPPSPVTIVLNNVITSLSPEGGTVAGVFTVTGALTAAGSGTVVFRVDADTMHCHALLTDAQGTITIHMQCRMVMTSETTGGGPGHWMITGGTGAYQNLHGTGTLTMDFNLGAFPPTAVEILEGLAFFDSRH